MSDYDRVDYDRTQQRSWLRAITPFAIVFVAGLLTMGWILTRWDAASSYLSWMRPPPKAVPLATASPPQLIVARGPDTAPLERRVSQLDNRIEDIAERAEAASGNADRAEGLLVAFAARRAIDRGIGLGYIEGLLRDRFGRSQPRAVATIISSARQPVTLEELRADLEAMAPDLVGASKDAGWVEGLQRELANLIVVRRDDMPSSTPDARIRRAKRDLDAGHVDRALAEISRLPGRDRALPWIERARRYVSAHNALDLVETSALLSPIPERRAAVSGPAG